MKVNCNKEGIAKASEIIKNGGIIVFPTDTVYGIGCNPYDQKAVKKIYKIKSREMSVPMPVLVFSKDVAAKIADFDGDSEKLAEKYWPGPLTLIVKLRDEKLQKSLNVKDKIALRVPDNDCVLKLLKKCNLLIGTSANISGKEPFTDPSKCYQSLKNFDLFLDGGVISGGTASTVAEMVEGNLKIHRKGVLAEKEMMKIL